MIRVLAIDDEEEVAELIKLQLETRGGFVVKTETDAANAIQSAREFGPDIILLDIMMPKKDGSEVAADFLGDATLKTTPLIFLTALVTTQEQKTSAVAPGQRTYLPKPINWEKLVNSIISAVRSESVAGR